MTGNPITAFVFLLIALAFALHGNSSMADEPGADNQKANGPDDILIIVNRSVKADSISFADLKRIFLKKKTTLESQRITPIHARSNATLRNVAKRDSLLLFNFRFVACGNCSSGIGRKQ